VGEAGTASQGRAGNYPTSPRAGGYGERVTDPGQIRPGDSSAGVAKDRAKAPRSSAIIKNEKATGRIALPVSVPYPPDTSCSVRLPSPSPGVTRGSRGRGGGGRRSCGGLRQSLRLLTIGFADDPRKRSEYPSVQRQRGQADHGRMSLRFESATGNKLIVTRAGARRVAAADPKARGAMWAFLRLNAAKPGDARQVVAGSDGRHR